MRPVIPLSFSLMRPWRGMAGHTGWYQPDYASQRKHFPEVARAHDRSCLSSVHQLIEPGMKMLDDKFLIIAELRIMPRAVCRTDTRLHLG